MILAGLIILWQTILISKSCNNSHHIYQCHTPAFCHLCLFSTFVICWAQTSAPETETNAPFVLLLRKLRPWESAPLRNAAQFKRGKAKQQSRTPDSSTELCPYIMLLSERKPRLIHFSLACCLMFITSIAWFPAFLLGAGSVLDAGTGRDGKKAPCAPHSHRASLFSRWASLLLAIVPKIEHEQTTITFQREIKILSGRILPGAWRGCRGMWVGWSVKASGWRKPGRLHDGSLWTEGVRGGPGRSKTFQVEKQGQESGMLKYTTPCQLGFQKVKLDHFTLCLRSFRLFV